MSMPIGGVYTFNRLSITLELNLESFVGRGEPDFSVALTPASSTRSEPYYFLAARSASRKSRLAI